MYDDQRSWRYLYKKKAWLDLAAAQKAKEPFCKYCLAGGLVNDGSLTLTGARQSNPKRRYLVADHVEAHKGDLSLFYDPNNLQSLCPDHHDRHKQAEEARGFSEERGIDGWPVDPRHPANAG